MDSSSKWISAGAFLAALAVIAGAFGAHALKGILTPERLETWNTAVQYHFWHSLSLMLIAFLGKYYRTDLKLPVILLLLGIIVFSGSLYTLCLADFTPIAYITPVGGASFIIGWLILSYKFFSVNNDK